MSEAKHENHDQYGDSNRDQTWRRDDAPNGAGQHDERANERKGSEDQYARDASNVD